MADQQPIATTTLASGTTLAIEQGTLGVVLTHRDAAGYTLARVALRLADLRKVEALVRETLAAVCGPVASLHRVGGPHVEKKGGGR